MGAPATCVIYCRISKDQAGDELGVQRQERECRQLAGRLGFTVAEVFVDDDVSAYRGRRRPGYQRMLAAVGSGVAGTVVAWHPDRLNRHPRELEDLIDFLEQHGVQVHTVVAGAYDLSTAAGRMTARVVGAVARHESEHKSERLRSKARQLAEQGVVGNGGTRPFGWEPDRMTVREDEAAVIRLAAGWVLDGLSLGEVARRLTATGVKPVDGGRWLTAVVRRTLLGPRVAGLRQHQGQVIGRAVWPAILDEQTYAAVGAVLRAPGRRLNTHARPYLLTGGTARCGACGGPLIARPRSGGDRCYVCASPTPQTAGNGCGKIRRLAEPVETEVLARLFATIAALPSIEAVQLVDDTPVLAEIARLDGLLAGLARDHYALGLIGRTEFLAARDALAEQADTARARLTPRARRRPAVAPARLQETWPDLSHEERRQHIADWIDAVIIHPARPGLNKFDPTRIEVRWRQ